MFPDLEYSILKNKVFYFTCRKFSSGLGNTEDVFTKQDIPIGKYKTKFNTTYGIKRT